MFARSYRSGETAWMRQARPSLRYSVARLIPKSDILANLNVLENGSFCLASNEPRHEISNNVVCATSKGSDHPAHTRSLFRAFASHLNIL